MTWHVDMRLGLRKGPDLNRPIDALPERIGKLNTSIRAKIKIPFQVIKRRFGHVKVRYRGLANNPAHSTRRTHCPTCGLCAGNCWEPEDKCA